MTSRIGMALDLMQRALLLLDEAGESHAAAHLQGAIDAARGERPMQPGDEVNTALAALIDEA